MSHFPFIGAFDSGFLPATADFSSFGFLFSSVAASGAFASADFAGASTP